MAVAGTHAYLANNDDGLRIYDISNPASPVNVGHIFEAGFARGVALAGNYAYVANGSDGLRIYDVSDSTTPFFVGHLSDSSASILARGVAVSGDYVYVANGSDGLRVYNAHIPSAITRTGHASNASGEAFGITLAGNLAYVAAGSDGLRIFDISNPAAPMLLSSTPTGAFPDARSIALLGNTAFVANERDGLRIYDVTTPAHPVEIGSINDGGVNDYAYSVAALAGYAYLADGTGGLHVYTVGNAIAPAFSGNGGQLTGLNASQVASGTLDDARLSGNIPLKNAAVNSFTGDLNIGKFLGVTQTTLTPLDTATIFPLSSFVRLAPVSAVTLNGTNPIASGASVGQILILEGTSDINTVTINFPPAGGSTRTSATHVLGVRDMLTLIWDGSKWAEMSYSNNN